MNWVEEPFMKTGLFCDGDERLHDGNFVDWHPREFIFVLIILKFDKGYLIYLHIYRFVYLRLENENAAGSSYKT